MNNNYKYSYVIYSLASFTILGNCFEITGDAEKIIYHALYGPAQNQSYNRLAEFTDTFGSRIAGSRNLENAIGKHVIKLCYFEIVMQEAW